jgi:hypothetical protein
VFPCCFAEFPCKSRVIREIRPKGTVAFGDWRRRPISGAKSTLFRKRRRSPGAKARGVWGFAGR